MKTLLAVVEQGSFTRAAEALSLTQPAVSHHISQLEDELGVPLFVRDRGRLKLTPEGEIAVKYAKRLTAIYGNLLSELQYAQNHVTQLKVGITHTSESNLTPEVLAKCSSLNSNLKITILTDTINNLYDMLGNYEIDLAIVEGAQHNPSFGSLMLDTDYLVCVMKWLNALIGSFLGLFGVDVSNRWGGSLQFFLYDVLKITILLCLLIFLISYIQSYFPPERSKKILGRFRGLWANCIAALLGTVTPFCSCSSIPLFIGFTSAGLPLGVTFSFLISSPMVDLGSLILLMSRSVSLTAVRCSARLFLG